MIMTHPFTPDRTASVGICSFIMSLPLAAGCSAHSHFGPVGTQDPSAWCHQSSGAVRPLAWTTAGRGRTSVNPWLYAIMGELMQAAQNPPPVPAQDVPAALALIRAALSLNTAELARILMVTRPTIYAWSEGSAEAKLAKRARISSIRALAVEWERLSSHTLGTQVREPSADGRSLVDLLSEEEPDEKSILSRLKNCAGELARRVATRGPSMREVLASRGVQPKPAPDHEFRNSVDWYSRIGK